MPESNYAALGEGLRLYTEAMRRLVKERLIAAYPNKWWDDGVVRNLTEAQRSDLKRNMERQPSKDKLEHIEAPQLVRIVSRNFDGAFAGVFSDFNKTQSLLGTVANARNEWAHPRSGDMLADEVGYALYAMEQVLSTAKLPEAAQVEKLRQEVLKLGKEPAPEPAKTAKEAPKGELPYWWQVCEPHDGFQNPAAVDESLFAATLGGVHAGSAREEYSNPKVFFEHTHFTENLKQTIYDVASRMVAGPGPAVTEMQTPFGGGKTHALLTLYHLIKNPQQSLAVPGVKAALGDVKIPSNARVLVFDGQEYGTDPIEKETGASVSTMWGEFAYQVDPLLYHKLLIDSDSNGVAPGNALFRQVLEAASPCLILIDELVSYLVKLRFSNQKRTQNLYRQTVQFIHDLLRLTGNVPGVCILISLPKSMREFGGLEPEQTQREIGVMADLQTQADAVVSKRTPVNDDEVYTLMSKRLFKSVDRQAAERVAKMYREVYQRTGGLYDASILSAEYQQHQIDAYPLHPELIDVLYKKWSTASDFPRTRAVLQLLASVVADQWVNTREAYAIQSAHVNLERERIRTKVVSAAGPGGGYDAVVATDIIGGDAHADMLDQKRGGDYERYHVARGVATTLLMHSFGGRTQPGALPSELTLGTVAPNVGPEYPTEVLGTLEQSLWYVHREGELRRFQTKPNIYRIITETGDAQPIPAVTERLRQALDGAAGNVEGFRVLSWAANDDAIADRPEPVIAILDPKHALGSENGAAVERITKLWEKSGGGLRQWRNALILVAADAEKWNAAGDAMRRVMGYESVLSGTAKKSIEVDKLELKGLESEFNDKKDSLRTSLVTACCHVFHPDAQGLKMITLADPATKSESIAQRAADRLSSSDYGNPKVLSGMGAVYFNSKIAPQVWKDPEAPLELGELGRRFLEWTYLPILTRRDETLRACAREGIAQDLWAVAIGDNVMRTYQQLIEKPGDLDGVVALFDGTASLVKGTLREEIRKQLGIVEEPPPGPKPPPPGPTPGGKPPVPPIPRPQRLGRVTLRFESLPIAKTSNLQPYLFKVLQEQDAGAELRVTIEVNSGVGIPIDVLKEKIAQGFEMLGIVVTWE